MTDDEDIIPVTVGNYFLGDENCWCWWESEYPEDMVSGPFNSKEEAEESVRLCAEASGTNMKVMHYDTAIPNVNQMFVEGLYQAANMSMVESLRQLAAGKDKCNCADIISKRADMLSAITSQNKFK